MTSLSAKIIGLREAKSISQFSLANAVPMNKGYLSLIEKGKNTNPSMKKLKGLAKALDVSTDYLADDSFIEYRSWDKVAADESLKLFLNKHKLSTEDIAGFKRVSFQPTSPLTIVEWERLLSNLVSINQKAPVSNPKNKLDTTNQIVPEDSSENNSSR